MNFFARPEILFSIPIVLLLLFSCHAWSRRIVSRRTKRLVSIKLLPQLLTKASSKTRWIKFLLLLVGFAFLLLALAGPQWGKSSRKVEPRGIDLLLAIDLSKSMLAQDVKPNRLERVKQSLFNCLDQVRGDRLGLIAFSGTSFLQCPLTLDHHAFAKTVEDLRVGLIPRPGTDLGSPIAEAARSFSKEDRDKFLILITDGEDLEGRGLMQAKAAAGDGIRIFTIGIGSESGANIPLDANGKFHASPQGGLTTTKLEASTLENIAAATGGTYLHLGPLGEGLVHVFSQLQKLGEEKSHSQLSTELPIDRFQAFIAIGMIFLLGERMTSTIPVKLFHAAMKCIPLALLGLSGGCQNENPSNSRALEAAKDRRFEQAAELCRKEFGENAWDGLLELDPSLETNTERVKELLDGKDSRLLLNAGMALLEGNDFQTSERLLLHSLEGLGDRPQLQAKALNALGNLHYAWANFFLAQQDVIQARQCWNRARKHYVDASALNSSKASANLEFLDRQLKERIERRVCFIQGKVWRDLDGNGSQESEEPGLKALVFWDRNDDGEHNASSEPAVATDPSGNFAFEWISSEYPSELRLCSRLLDENHTLPVKLAPLYPPPPPPFQSSISRKLLMKLDDAGHRFIHMPYRAPPVLQGYLWNDANENGVRDGNETGLSSASLFLDENDNFRIDENETVFNPNQDGVFFMQVMPASYVVCVQPKNPEAKVTFPSGHGMGHRVELLDFEMSSEALAFGIKDDSSDEQSSSQDESDSQNQSQESKENSSQKAPSSPQSQDNPQDSASRSRSDSSDAEEASEDLVESAQSEDEIGEVKALYERLLQENEAKSKPIDQELRLLGPVAVGRDY